MLLNYLVNIGMAANGISTLSTKQLRQEGKLDIAEAKRQGKVVATDGSISGGVDATKEYYRARNVTDINLLPTKHDGNGISDNVNLSGLVAVRPWRSKCDLERPRDTPGRWRRGLLWRLRNGSQ